MNPEIQQKRLEGCCGLLRCDEDRLFVVAVVAEVAAELLFRYSARPKLSRDVDKRTTATGMRLYGIACAASDMV
jgi:hypothetical protein